MQTITQTRTSTPTTEVKEYPVPSFWKETSFYPKFFALLAPDLVMLITNVTAGGQPTISIQNKLFSCDTFDTQIEADEFSAAYEAAQLAITDAFQTAFPSPVHLEMAHEFNEND